MTPSYTVHLCPPQYPAHFRPFECGHAPLYQMCDTRLEWDSAGRGKAVMEHARCLACGAPVGSQPPSNIFVSIDGFLADDVGSIGEIRGRLLTMRDAYMRMAETLFGPEGWLGDEDRREMAELIDPNLTMRVIPAGEHGDGTRFFRLMIDESYWPTGDAAPVRQAATAAQGELPL